MRIAIATICLLMFTFTSAFAEMTVDTYKRHISGEKKEKIETYIKGVGSGIGWLNELSEKKAYCSPNATLTIEDFKKIIDAQYERSSDKYKTIKKEMGWVPVELVLLHGLINSFPCE